MGDNEVSGGRLVRNTLANAFASGVVALLAVVMTPFFLRRLGPAEYGVWLLATTLTFANGYLGLADLGLQQAGVRLVAEARSRGDEQRVNEVISTMAVLFVVVGTVLGALLAAVASTVSDVFSIEPALRAAATAVFALVGAQIAVDLPGASLLAVIEGAQRYAALRLVDVGGRVVWAATALVVVLQGGGVVAMGAASLVIAVLFLGVAYVLARRVEPNLRISPKGATRATLGQILRQGVSLLVLRVTSVVYRQMDRAILGITLTSSAVARYEVAYKIHATAAMVLSVAPSAVMPAAAFLHAAEDRDHLRSLYLRGTKYTVALSLPVTLAALLYAGPLIRTWVGDEYEGMTAATQLFLVYPILVSVHVIGLTMLVGLGRMREMVVLSPAAVLCNLVVSVALAPRLGIIGVIWGTLAGYVLIWFPYLRLMLKSFAVGVAEWTRAVVLPNVPGTSMQVAFGFATVGVADRLTQLWQVAALGATSCLLSVAVFLFVVLRRAERSRLVATLPVPRSLLGRSGALPLQDEEARILRHELESGPTERPQ